MCTKFVHADTGKGKKATLEKPAKDLGNIISKLESGDVVCIAEGEYTVRGKRGVDIIKLPVSIIGGFNAEFTSRDPWGEFKTIFTGLHNSKNFETQTRLTINTTKAATKLMEARNEPTEHIIIVDGLIFDNGPRNFYSDESESLIVRKGTPKQTPTLESGALTIKTGISEKWLVKYMSRTLIDRNAAEEDVKVVESWENDVRSIFGLNLTGTDLNIDSAVWLPRMDMTDVLVGAVVSHDLAGVEPPAAQSW